MKLFRKVVSSFSLVFCLSFLFSNVTVFADTTDYTNSGITISMRDDGLFRVTTDKQEGTLYYSYKLGKTEADLAYPVYTAGTPICYYDVQGELLREDANAGGTPEYNDSPSSWSRANMKLQQLNLDSAYNRKEGDVYKVIDLTAPVEDASTNWFDLCLQSDSVVKMSAVYKFSDGTYSDVVSQTFNYTVDGATSSTTPKLSIKEVSRTADAVTLGVTMSVSSDSAKLVALNVTSGVLAPVKIPLDKQSAYSEYKVEYNGDYKFEVTTNSGTSCWITWHEENLSGLGAGGNPEPKTDTKVDNEAPVLSFSGIPESIAFGDSFTMSVNSSEICSINYGGSTYTDVSNIDVTISDNGTYTFLVSDKAGNSNTCSVDISCFPSSEELPENQGYSIDIEHYWDDVMTGATLPQTGGIALAVIVALCLVGVGVGIFLVRKKKISTVVVSSESCSEEEG